MIATIQEGIKRHFNSKKLNNVSTVTTQNNVNAGLQRNFGEVRMMEEAAGELNFNYLGERQSAHIFRYEGDIIRIENCRNIPSFKVESTDSSTSVVIKKSPEVTNLQALCEALNIYCLVKPMRCIGYKAKEDQAITHSSALRFSSENNPTILASVQPNGATLISTPSDYDVLVQFLGKEIEFVGHTINVEPHTLVLENHQLTPLGKTAQNAIATHESIPQLLDQIIQATGRHSAHIGIMLEALTTEAPGKWEYGKSQSLSAKDGRAFYPIASELAYSDFEL